MTPASPPAPAVITAARAGHTPHVPAGPTVVLPAGPDRAALIGLTRTGGGG